MLLIVPKPIKVGVVPTVVPLAGALTARLAKIQLALLLLTLIQFKQVTVLVKALESWTLSSPTL